MFLIYHMTIVYIIIHSYHGPQHQALNKNEQKQMVKQFMYKT